ncbi:hypothetical protein K458DRAFT_402375 [Lentithecium fluviatile CBS 122367]|uniref:RRM domain-containing protein n=1 Tax=Lentithecium fluviatile CBS 122367 TaxID=1168545 RepID=A0A6G1J9I8_9PLEO|nr:hypothetical protein K458DRAFT_402375 [Lentithecium fluviatile CBS 122367]
MNKISPHKKHSQPPGALVPRPEAVQVPRPGTATPQPAAGPPKPASPEPTAVEVSNFPPRFSKPDLEKLFHTFQLSRPITLPCSTHFSRPLRTTVYLFSREEASRAVKALHGTLVGCQAISVRMADMKEEERKVAVVEALADELKIGVINTARVYYPHLTNSILEVREHTEKNNFLAFLQAREPVTIHSDPEVQAISNQNFAQWKLVAAGAASEEDFSREKDQNARLEALKGLQMELERQGVLKRIWSEWEGTWKLDMTAF